MSPKHIIIVVINFLSMTSFVCKIVYDTVRSDADINDDLRNNTAWAW